MDVDEDLRGAKIRDFCGCMANATVAFHGAIYLVSSHTGGIVVRLIRAEGLGVGGKRLDVSAERRSAEHGRDGAQAAHSFLHQLRHLQGYVLGCFGCVCGGGGGKETF
jgi:hypothetical protein